MISVVLSHIVVNYLRRNDESFFTYVLRDAMANISYLLNGALGMDSFFVFFFLFLKCQGSGNAWIEGGPKKGGDKEEEGGCKVLFG